MTDEPSPRPWRVDDSSTHETMGRKFVLIRDANGQKITVDSGRMFDEDAALIVDAVNQYEWANKEIHRLLVEKDNMFDEAVGIRKERNHLRDLVKRLITVHENIYWRKDEQTGMLYVGCAIDEEKIRKTIEEAREAIKGDK